MLHIVYFGPGLSGKRTSLRRLYEAWPEARRSEVERAGEGVFTFALDACSPNASLRSVRVSAESSNRFHAMERARLFEECDGVVFVADSRSFREEANRSCWEVLEAAMRGRAAPVPVVVQLNRRDAEDAMSVDEIMKSFRSSCVVGFVESVAVDLEDEGVIDAFSRLIGVLIGSP